MRLRAYPNNPAALRVMSAQASGHPFLKAQVGGGARADARGIQGFPLAPGRQHVEHAVGAGAVRNPRTATAEPMSVHTYGDQRLQHLPEFVGLVLVAGPARLGRGGLASFALVIAPVWAQSWLPGTGPRVFTSY